MQHKDFEQRFCGNIRALRAAQGLSIPELSAKSGVPLELLRQMEQNSVPDSFMVDHIFDLARALGCSPYELCK